MKRILIVTIIVLGIGILLLAHSLNKVSKKIENIRNGDIEEGAITLDKLSEDVFKEIEITKEDGSKIAGVISDISVENGVLIGKLTLISEDDGTVTEFEIEDGSITEEKLSEELAEKIDSLEGFTLGEGDVMTVHLADGSVTEVKIEDGAVTSTKILDGSITNTDISPSAGISWSKISKVGSSIADLDTRDFSDLNGRTADLLTISDAGGYYTSTEVEGALQELGVTNAGLDNTYLRLDASNDPITGDLSINADLLVDDPDNGTTQLKFGHTGSQHSTIANDPTFPRLLISSSARLYLSSGWSTNISAEFGTSINMINPGIISFSTLSQERMRVDEDGYIGIGTTDPGSQLHISTGNNNPNLSLQLTNTQFNSGSIRFYTKADASGTALLFNGTPTFTSSLITNISKDYPTATAGRSAWAIETTHTDKFLIHSKNSDAGGAFNTPFTIDINGRVGIGTTSPTSSLDVRHSTANTGSILSNLATNNSQVGAWNNNYQVNLRLMNLDSTDNNYTNIGFYGSDTTSVAAGISSQTVSHAQARGNLAFFTRGSTGWDQRMTIHQDGNVAIGTTDSGTDKLRVAGNIAIRTVDSGLILERPGFSESWRTYVPSGGHLRIERLGGSGNVLIPSGNLGIAAADPLQKLEVNGGIRLNTATAKPTCDANVRGTVWFVQGGVGVKDTYEVCAKDAGNLYAWRTIY